LPNVSLTLDQVRAAMAAAGVTRLFAKPLSPNDNSKNQIYLGGDLSVINTLPAGDPVASTSGKHDTPIFKAALRFLWLDDAGRTAPAPNAQLILYPQYPEVRMSGFLLRAPNAPRELLASRDAGRILLLGVTRDECLVGYAAPAESPLAREVAAMSIAERTGVLLHIPLNTVEGADSRARLLEALCRISRQEWINGWRLLPTGVATTCVAPNCVGITLESELGITSNGRAEPDFDGWEVKAHTVASFARDETGTVTLLTPEPTGGVYATEGALEFVRRFGYADKRGREDRLNFGGVHKVGEVCAATSLTMMLDGFDVQSGKITKSDGALQLVTATGVIAASWSFAGLLAHWNRKHAKAVYVPALKRKEPFVGFRYGSHVMLAEGTDYRRFFDGLASGLVYYDPGIKVESASSKPAVKKRSQFRIRRSLLNTLYHRSAKLVACQ
jgi:hypothetical protein